MKQLKYPWQDDRIQPSSFLVITLNVMSQVKGKDCQTGLKIARLFTGGML